MMATPSLQVTRLATSASSKLPDADNIAEHILRKAISFCAEKTNEADTDAALDRIRKGDRTTCDYYVYGLAKYLAASLGALDEHARAAYTLEYEAISDDACYTENGPGAPMVHLIVWTKRKTAAFHALVGALDYALARALAARFGRAPQQSVLDVQLVDDQDLANRTSYGALFHAIHHRPLQVWER
jgi:hypothetical protein